MSKKKAKITPEMRTERRNSSRLRRYPSVTGRAYDGMFLILMGGRAKSKQTFVPLRDGGFLYLEGR